MSPIDTTPSVASAAVVAHLDEIDARLTTLQDGIETFLPLIMSVVREVGRAQEDVTRSKRQEQNPEIAGRLPMLEQRNIALQRVALELQQSVAQLADMMHEYRYAASDIGRAVAAAAAPAAPLAPDVAAPAP